MSDPYTPGHSVNATAFMATRSFVTHGGRPVIMNSSVKKNQANYGVSPHVVNASMTERAGCNRIFCHNGKDVSDL
jgi:hypothetical protein